MTAPFAAGKHPRAAGGKFSATAGAAKPAHATGAWASGPVRNGTGSKDAPDSRVSSMQRKLNALGFGDEHGHPLLVDGIAGNHTTAAVKKFQAANGLPQTGVVDAKLMVAILSAKPAPKKVTAASKMGHGARHGRGRGRKSSAKKPPAAAPAPYVDKGRGFSRFGAGVST